jgi:hypothetical protein
MSEVDEETSGILPLSYGDDKISLFARDPYWLYAYWEITKEKSDAFIREFGTGIWEKSIPVLKVTNVAKEDSFYIRINEFSDSWYINVPEPGSLYTVEIGRRVSDRFFISMAGSNHAVTPRDHMSTNRTTQFVDVSSYDVKSGFVQPQPIDEPDLPRYLWNDLQVAQGIGTSSLQVYGKDLSEHLGLSSASLLKG